MRIFESCSHSGLFLLWCSSLLSLYSFIRDLLISHEISCGPPSTVLRDKKVLKSVGSLSVCVRALPAWLRTDRGQVHA